MNGSDKVFVVCSLCLKQASPNLNLGKFKNYGSETFDSEAIYDYTLDFQKRSSTRNPRSRMSPIGDNI